MESGRGRTRSPSRTCPGTSRAMQRQTPPSLRAGNRHSTTAAAPRASSSGPSSLGCSGGARPERLRKGRGLLCASQCPKAREQACLGGGKAGKGTSVAARGLWERGIQARRKLVHVSSDRVFSRARRRGGPAGRGGYMGRGASQEELDGDVAKAES